ncbi:MAG: hypothetical protein ACI81P_000320 [Neolewinella sp.]|jgi:hypothetical protein
MPVDKHFLICTFTSIKSLPFMSTTPPTTAAPTQEVLRALLASQQAFAPRVRAQKASERIEKLKLMQRYPGIGW